MSITIHSVPMPHTVERIELQWHLTPEDFNMVCAVYALEENVKTIERSDSPGDYFRSVRFNLQDYWITVMEATYRRTSSGTVVGSDR